MFEHFAFSSLLLVLYFLSPRCSVLFRNALYLAPPSLRFAIFMLNALTIDVEDYYHVAAFESVIRHEEWDRFESLSKIWR